METVEAGNIVEYIDHQKIICGVILEVKKQKLRILTENNRESRRLFSAGYSILMAGIISSQIRK